MTCASDRTLRFWHFIDQGAKTGTNQQHVQKGLFRNAYCKDMSKIIFVKNSPEVEKYQYEVFKSKPLERNEDGKLIE